MKGVGPKSAEKLQRLGINTVQDVLFHLPLRYEDRTRVVPVGSLRAGDQAVIEVEVNHAEIRFGRRRSLLVHVSDGTGSLILRFFYFNAAQKNNLTAGKKLRCFGEVRNGPACLELIHPEYRGIDEEQEGRVEETLTPVYPTTEGMHQITWRDLTQKALVLMGNERQVLKEWLPEDLLQKYGLWPIEKAIRYIHRPPPDAAQELMQEGRHPAQQRLAFEELLAHQISLRKLRRQQQSHVAPRLDGEGGYRQQLLESLPFRLTGAQQRVLQEISADLKLGRPMLRLVQGDVGSGKTVVAALAALQAIESGYQVALMAPTELLSEQHRNNLESWLLPLGVKTGWLTGKVKGNERKQLLSQLEIGALDLVIGTQALFQSEVKFNALGLIIVDEQHRFGVHQRMALKNKGVSANQHPHQLIMTATPIPRSLAMTAYADLDLSVIDELPPGRTPVKTVVMSDARREEVIERVNNACSAGRQAYWVCTLIEESEALQCQAAEDTVIALQESLPALRIGLVHGRLSTAEKEQVMASFKSGEMDLLVATTVIEVGVDVPAASLMIIENPERLGLSQLHQLRGRVGRGSTESHCVLMYHPPLGRNAQERLGILRESNDGFRIARKDLELRGPGEVLGIRQTGEMQFRIADLMRDQHLLPAAQQAADKLLVHHNGVTDPLIERWLGSRVNYAQV